MVLSQASASWAAAGADIRNGAYGDARHDGRGIDAQCVHCPSPTSFLGSAFCRSVTTALTVAAND
jgi:hypothetical protein